MFHIGEAIIELSKFSCRVWKGPSHLLKRCTSTEWANLSERPKEKVTNMPPMSEPIKGLPRAVYANFREENQQTKVPFLETCL